VVGEADIASVAAVLADESRAAMLAALLGGESLSAGELARQAGLSRSGASNHLRRLREAGLVTADVSGRNRYFRLASDELAGALEALALVAPPKPIRSLRQSDAARALKEARTCYDHLAGELGVAVAAALVERRLLAADPDAFRVTPRGERWFAQLGIDVASLRRSRRSFARACVDWTEREPHLAGSLGAALAAAFLAGRFVARRPGSRALTVTPAGADWLEQELGVGGYSARSAGSFSRVA
jgi:DNA-binding transcriptional ArsR family regulator